MTPRSPAARISLPGMLTVAMPDLEKTSAEIPVWRHLRPFRSAQLFTGRLNQPMAWGPAEVIGIGTTFCLSTTWKNSRYSSSPPPS